MTGPDLPYAGTSGWSGSDASHDRAIEADKSGKTENRQRTTRMAIRRAGPDGLTWPELSRMTGWHHGKATGPLSILHKSGDICRLKNERRENCSVYVTPENVNGRPTAPHGRKDPVHDALVEWLTKDPNDGGWSKAGRNPTGFVKAMRAITGIE